MSSSLIAVLWIAWFAGLVVVAVLRYRIVRRKHSERAERQQAREPRVQHKVARRILPAGYRDQLIAAGLIKPATEPDSTPDPATNT
jgi:Flp pilus assembly protein CpaB